MNKKLRIVFMGTPEFAVATLRAIADAGWPIVGVVTAPDKPAGRGLQLRPSPVKVFAASKGMRILQPEKLRNPEFLDALAALKADLQVVVAFRMLPEIVWIMPPAGSINLHASLLPAYRGAAPINHAVMNGETETGLTTFFLQHEVDTGDLLDQVRVPIGADETAGELHDRMMEVGAALVLRSLDKIESGQLEGTAQDLRGDFPRAPKIFREDCRIDWNKPSLAVHNFVRGLSPHPTAWTMWNEHTFKIFRSRIPGDDLPAELSEIRETRSLSSPGNDQAGEAVIPGTCKMVQDRLFFATAGSWIELLEVQWEGKKRMTAAEFLRGFRG